MTRITSYNVCYTKLLRLGLRAETRLPPALGRWYFEINQKMGSEGRAVSRPCYQDLADTLRQAFRRLDASFLMP